MKALAVFTTKSGFVPLIIGFKRAHRLVQKERWERQPVEPARFQHPAESVLHKVWAEERGKMTVAMNIGDFGNALEALVRLKPSIDTFFTAVMVNADDKAIRSNRLSLLKLVDEMFMSFADFSEIMVEGD